MRFYIIESRGMGKCMYSEAMYRKAKLLYHTHGAIDKVAVRMHVSNKVAGHLVATDIDSDRHDYITI